ncbi:MAG TPA: TatD family hydrolase [Planctomycetota bacterium]|nr:TatD family hydrolase [Planctomycetota bacterium]
MELVDTHAHTNFDAFDGDREEMYDRARAAGIVAIVEVGVGLEGTRAALARSKETDLVYAAGGLHPTGLDTFETDWTALERLIRTEDFTAVGECGLDYHWMKAPKATQEEAFRRQINLARQMSLPYIVHCREAETDVLRILRDEGYPRGVVHCFGGTRAEAEEFLSLGLAVTFCGNVTYKNAERLREAARAVPLDKLMLETDAPFLPPGAKRGKRNEPAFVAGTAAFLAEIKGVGVEELARATTRNARRFFDLKPKGPGKIAYAIGDALYVNLTRLCTAHCYFCPREGPDRVAWGHDLALARDPSPREVLQAVGDPSGYREIVYCGLGEPMIRLETLLETAKAIRTRGTRIRVNTNGHGNLIHGTDITPRLEGVVDALSISLNYSDAALYEKHCPSTFGMAAFEGILDFARAAKAHVHEVTFTVVEGAEDVDVSKCRAIAAACGVGFRARPLDDLKASGRTEAPSA